MYQYIFDNERSVIAENFLAAVGLLRRVYNSSYFNYTRTPVVMINPKRIRRPKRECLIPESLITSISQHGILTPITVGPDRVVKDGYKRLLCARVLGHRTVPVAGLLYEIETGISIPVTTKKTIRSYKGGLLLKETLELMEYGDSIFVPNPNINSVRASVGKYSGSFCCVEDVKNNVSGVRVFKVY